MDTNICYNDLVDNINHNEISILNDKIQMMIKTMQNNKNNYEVIKLCNMYLYDSIRKRDELLQK